MKADRLVEGMNSEAQARGEPDKPDGFASLCRHAAMTRACFAQSRDGGTGLIANQTVYARRSPPMRRSDQTGVQGNVYCQIDWICGHACLDHPSTRA